MVKGHLQDVESLRSLEPFMFQMEADGIWEMTQRNIVIYHSASHTKGLLHVFIKN